MIRPWAPTCVEVAEGERRWGRRVSTREGPGREGARSHPAHVALGGLTATSRPFGDGIGGSAAPGVCCHRVPPGPLPSPSPPSPRHPRENLMHGGEGDGGDAQQQAPAAVDSQAAEQQRQAEGDPGSAESPV
jgi:hypothetical protein